MCLGLTSWLAKHFNIIIVKKETVANIKVKTRRRKVKKKKQVKKIKSRKEQQITYKKKYRIQYSFLFK